MNATLKRYIFIIIGLSFILYANTLNNEFVSDDLPAIINNPNIADIFSAPDATSFTNSLNYLAAKTNPPLYHLTNILLHCLNSVLAFFFLGLFFGLNASFWGSLIFAAHPIHTEAVTWISGRGYLIFTFFLLSSFLFYVDATSKDKLKLKSFLLSLLMYIFSLGSASFSYLYPGMLVLYDFTFGKVRKHWKLWLIFFALTSFKAVSVVWSLRERIAQVSLDTGQTLTNPIFNMAFSIFTSSGLLIWPQKLTLYHDPPIITPLVLGVYLTILALLILSLPFIFKRSRELFFAIGLFTLFLVPTYSPVMISWLVAERYIYFPSLALSIAVAFLAAKSDKFPRLRTPLSLGLILLVTAYSVRTIIRNLDWKTHSSIWRATVKVSPESPKAHNNMGDVYFREGNLRKAGEEFIRAIELKPNLAEAYHNLAYTYQNMGRFDAAIANYEKALALRPALYQSYQNLGIIYFNQGLMGLAREYFRKAYKINPEGVGIKQTLADLERRQ